MNLLERKKTLLVLIALIVLAILAYRLFDREGVSITYKTARVDRGSISSYVTATGTVSPTTKVEITSQVSGTIKNVYVDFNSVVKKGDLLAEIDQAPFKAELRQAEANLKKAQADVRLAKVVMDANEELYGKRLIPKQEYDDSKVRYSSAVASVEQAKAQVELARSKLSYSIIRSPIDGVVMSKNANVGQTIAIGQGSSPLFVLAEDLTRIDVDAHVSEADIGRIDIGQEALFTVDAYPNQTFKGTVRQIRNEPITKNNVVTYDVIILVDNEGLKLKPGMTAEVRILVAHKEDVLRVPRSALRFIPPPSASIERDSGEQRGSPVVWVPATNGRIRAVSIDPGISDDSFTEITDGRLKEGDEVIVEAVSKGESGSEPLGPLILPKPQRF